MAVRELAENLRARLTFQGGAPDKKTVRTVAIVVVTALALYYPIGAMMVHKIDDAGSFDVPTSAYDGGKSHAVALSAALLNREINDNGWTPNDPFFFPTAILDNMPNYQTGIVSALARFSFELMDQIGRTRGSSQVDTDLKSAAGLLQYPGDVWVWDPSVSIAPTATSEAQYRKALHTLRTYNDRVARGEAVFDRRADNLLATLDRIALDLGSASAVIEDHLDQAGGFGIDTKADDIFYTTKGQLYAYSKITAALQTDFESIITEKGLNQGWAEMLETMKQAADLQPFVVSNASPDGALFPSHLAAQGFYLLRARTQLREMTNVLLK